MEEKLKDLLISQTSVKDNSLVLNGTILNLVDKLMLVINIEQEKNKETAEEKKQRVRDTRDLIDLDVSKRYMVGWKGGALVECDFQRLTSKGFDFIDINTGNRMLSKYLYKTAKNGYKFSVNKDLVILNIRD